MDQKHTIVQCFFQIDLPHKSRETFVYEQISSLCQTRLQGLLGEILDELSLPADTHLQIDRLELDLGDLTVSDFENQLIQKIHVRFKDQLTAHLHQHKEIFLTRQAVLQQTLSRFFFKGQLSPGFTEDAPAALLLEFCAEYPDAARSSFQFWLAQPLARRRLLLQVLSPSLSTLNSKILNYLKQWELLRALYPDASQGAVLESYFLSALTPVDASVSQEMAVQTGRSPEPAAEQPVGDKTPLPTAPVLPLKTTGVPPPQYADVLYYLKQGTFPPGKAQSAQSLEATLLEWLSTQPHTARQYLTALPKEANWAARIARQFSPLVWEAVLYLYYPGQAPGLKDTFTYWATALPNKYPGRIPAGFWWGRTLTLLLPGLPTGIDLPRLFEYLKQETATLLKEDPDVLGRSLLAALPAHASALSAAQRAFAPLSEAAHQQIRMRMEQRMELESLEKTSESMPPEPTAAHFWLERLVHRLLHGTAPWWDDMPEQSFEALLQQVAVQPDPVRQPVLARLLSADYVSLWLPQLPIAAFERLLHVFWGDYAALAVLLYEGGGSVSSVRNQTFPIESFRSGLLSWAASGQSVDSLSLVNGALHLLAGIAGRPLETWIADLSEYAENGLVRGDIHYHPLLNALKKRETQQEVPLSFLVPPDSGVPSAKLLPDWTEPDTTAAAPPSDFGFVIQAELEALWQLLVYGHVPPTVTWENASAMRQALQRLATRHPELTLPVLQRALKSPGAVARLLRHGTPTTWQTIARLIWGVRFVEVLQLKNELFALLGPSQSPKDEREPAFWQLMLDPPPGLLPDPGAAGSTDFSETSFAVRWLETMIQHLGQSMHFPESLIWAQIRGKISSDTVNSPRESDMAPNDANRFLFQQLLQRHEAEQARAAVATVRKKWLEQAGLEGAGVLVHNAGLVLLAPFLPRYFDMLGMLENRAFKSPETAERAALLLQYLASGQSAVSEHLLVFNKLLCGLPLETPLPYSIELTELELQTSQSLLEAVIQNWERMKNTSLANLRGAFLLREGSLREMEAQWMLHVERKAYDVVLEFLPWTISMIKLPWMEKRVDVTWKKKV